MLLYYCYRRVFVTKSKSWRDIFSTPYGKCYSEHKDKIKALMQEVGNIPCERVSVKSYDGLWLSARYYHTRDNAPLEIMFHGYRSSAICDFSGGVKLAIKNGHNILLVDQRGHGESEGKYLTFGVKERFDCLTWINYAIERFGKDIKIILDGVSMGAATVLFAAGLDLPDNVVGIFADSPYTTPIEIIEKVCRDMSLPPKLAMPLIKLAAKLYMKCNLKVDARETVKTSKVPILIIHGEADKFVPCEMSREIYKNCKDGDVLVTIPGAGHVLGYMTDPAEYEESIEKFIKRVVS